MYILFIKCLISFQNIKNIRKMDSTYITECRYSGPVSQQVNQTVRQSVLDRETDVYKCIISFLKIQNIRKMNSTYITECGYNGPLSQPASQSVSHSVSLTLIDRLTSAIQSVCLSLTSYICSQTSTAVHTST